MEQVVVSVLAFRSENQTGVGLIPAADSVQQLRAETMIHVMINLPNDVWTLKILYKSDGLT